MADSKKMEVALVLSAYDKMTRVVNNATSNAIRKMESIKKTSDAISKNAFGTGRETGAAGAALAAPIIGATVLAAKLEDKMADVAKVMNMKVGSNEFMAMNNQAKDLAVYLSKMPEDAAGLMASLAQGGVAKKDMQDVSKIAGEMAVAFNIGAEYAGEQFVKSKNALGATIPQIKQLMDSINHLSDNDAAKASQILEYMAAGGSGVAKTLGVAGPTMAAFGSSLISMGKSGAEAATIMERFQKGVFESETMNAIYKKAGGGAEGLMAILKKGAQLKGDEQFKFFSNFGMYGVNIMQMAQSLGHVNDNMKLVANSNNYLNSVTKEFNNRNSTTIGQFNKIKAEAMITAIELGETMLPAVQELIREGRPMLKTITEWVKNNKELVGTLMKGGAVLSAVLLTISAFSFGIGGIAKIVSFGASGLSMFFRGVKAVQYALFAMRYTMAFQVMPTLVSFNAALLANPIGAIVAAIVLAIAAVTILVIKWKEITKWYRESSVWMKIALAPLMLANSALIGLAWAIRKVIDNWPAIKNFFTSIPKYVSNIIPALKNAGYNIVKAIAAGMIPGGGLAMDAMAAITKKMREYLPFSPAKRGAFMDLHKVKIVETIAGSMRSAPLEKAMANTTRKASAASGKNSSSSSGSTVINYNPTINFTGGNVEDFKKLLSEHADHIYRLVEGKAQNKARLSFS